MYGGVLRGRLFEEKAAVLAKHGFCTFALGFFGIEDLPKKYGKMDVEYFEEAIDMLLERVPRVDPDRVGMFGFSKGGDLTLSCAAFIGHKVKAAALLNSSVGSIMYPTTYKDRTVQGYTWEAGDSSRDIKFDEKTGAVDILNILKPVEEANPDSLIPFYSTPTDLLFIAGENDHNYDSASFARFAERKMTESGKSNFEVCILPSMGHMANLPFSPPVTVINHPLAPPGVMVYMGGADDLDQHVKGQSLAWHKTVDFFKRKLMI